MIRRNLLFCAFGVLTLLIAAVSLMSCEKAYLSDDESANDPNGNLKVKVFQIEQTPFAATTRAAVSNVCTRLNFAVYDESGSRVKQVNQTSDKAGFGTCSFQLDEGDYYLVVVGHSANGNPTMTNAAKIQFTNATGYTDTFASSGDVTIGDEPSEVEVTLDRIVARCSFVITDAFPAEVKKLQFYYTGGSGAFSAYTGLGSVNSKQTVTFDVSQPTTTLDAPVTTSGGVTIPAGRQFDIFTFLHEPSDDIALKVSALDASGNVLYERVFDVPMQQNHITWLTGAFFTGSGSSSSTVTTITVNTDWAGETHLTF